MSFSIIHYIFIEQYNFLIRFSFEYNTAHLNFLIAFPPNMTLSIEQTIAEGDDIVAIKVHGMKRGKVPT